MVSKIVSSASRESFQCNPNIPLKIITESLISSPVDPYQLDTMFSTYPPFSIIFFYSNKKETVLSNSCEKMKEEIVKRNEVWEREKKNTKETNDSSHNFNEIKGDTRRNWYPSIWINIHHINMWMDTLYQYLLCACLVVKIAILVFIRVFFILKDFDEYQTMECVCEW